MQRPRCAWGCLVLLLLCGATLGIRAQDPAGSTTDAPSQDDAYRRIQDHLSAVERHRLDSGDVPLSNLRLQSRLAEMLAQRGVPERRMRYFALDQGSAMAVMFMFERNRLYRSTREVLEAWRLRRGRGGGVTAADLDYLERGMSRFVESHRRLLALMGRRLDATVELGATLPDSGRVPSGPEEALVRQIDDEIHALIAAAPFFSGPTDPDRIPVHASAAPVLERLLLVAFDADGRARYDGGAEPGGAVRARLEFRPAPEGSRSTVRIRLIRAGTRVQEETLAAVASPQDPLNLQTDPIALAGPPGAPGPRLAVQPGDRIEAEAEGQVATIEVRAVRPVLRFVRSGPDGGFELAEDPLVYGESYFLEARFDRDPGSERVRMTLDWGGTGNAMVDLRRSPEDPLVFRTVEIRLEPTEVRR